MDLIKSCKTNCFDLNHFTQLFCSRAHWLYDESHSCWWFVFWREQTSPHEIISNHLSGSWTSSSSSWGTLKFSQVNWEMKSLVLTSVSPTSQLCIEYLQIKTLRRFGSICELLLAVSTDALMMQHWNKCLCVSAGSLLVLCTRHLLFSTHPIS